MPLFSEANALLSLFSRLTRFLQNDINVDVLSFVHEPHQDGWLHQIELRIHNKTDRTLRIDDISVYDELGRKMKLVSCDGFYPPLPFDLRDEEKWLGCFTRGPTEKTEQIKLKLSVSVLDSNTLWRDAISKLDDIYHGPHILTF
jgi:hypothetical protein